jgi:hypothetical protein
VTTIHDPIDQVASRDWEFTGLLLDYDCNPLPLTDAQIAWRLDTLDGVTNLLVVSLANGVSVTNFATGEILVDVPAAQTATVPAGSYRDWLTVTLATGQVLDEWSGIIRVTAAPA